MSSPDLYKNMSLEPAQPVTSLTDILVPRSMLQDPDRFGGTRRGDCNRGDLVLSGGHVTGMAQAPETENPRMLVPALIEAHCHLDKCHSIARLGTVGGDLAAAIGAQAKDKERWTEQDLRARMTTGLSELTAAGCQAVRSHIDWGDAPEAPLAWSVLQDLAAAYPALTLQAAALTGIDQLADTSFCTAAARQVAAAPGGVLGAFVLAHDADDVQAGLRNAFEAADRFGLALDFHVDEGLGPFNGLEAICDVALNTGFQGPVLCGHAVSLIDRTGADRARIIDKLLRAGISICALPTTNLYLQGRRQGTPDRRGLTALQELHDAAVPIVLASDNVGDAFCPMGQHDPRAALHLAALAAHLDPPMAAWLPAVTLNAARALGLDPPYIETTALKNLRLCAVATTADLVAGRRALTPFPAQKEAHHP